MKSGDKWGVVHPSIFKRNGRAAKMASLKSGQVASFGPFLSKKRTEGGHKRDRWRKKAHNNDINIE